MRKSHFGEGAKGTRNLADKTKDSIFSIREREVTTSDGLGIHRTKGVACAVEIAERKGLLTWKEVFNEQTGANPIWRDRPKGKASVKIEHQELVEEHRDKFSFLPLPDAKDVEFMQMEAIDHQQRPASKNLMVYAIDGCSRFKVNFDEKDVFKVESADEKADACYGGVEKSSIIGSPIVSQTSSCVVGVVGLDNEGKLFPYFIRPEDYESFKKAPDKVDAINLSTSLSSNGNQIPQRHCYQHEVESDRPANPNEMATMDDYLQECGKKRVPVSGDGHCILHAFAFGLNTLKGQKITAESLIPDIKAEFKRNLDRYRKYVNHDQVHDPVKELEIYLESKNHNVGVVDLMLHILGNMMGTTIEFYSINGGQVSEQTIPPYDTNQPEQSVSLCKIGEHYDAVIANCNAEEQDEYQATTNGGPLEQVTGPSDAPPEDISPLTSTQDSVKKGKVGLEILPDLAYDVQDKWRELHNTLQRDKSEASSITEDNEGDVYEKSYKMLYIWLQSRGNNATYASLAHALQQAELIEVRHNYCLVNSSVPRSAYDFKGLTLKRGTIKENFPSLELTDATMARWKRIGRQLKLKENKLDAIDHDHRKLLHRCNEMLTTWKQANGRAATYEKLAEALLHRTVDLKTVVEDHLCQ